VEEIIDHQAFAQLPGNYGESLGAIAVVATLIYLAHQIRETTKATRVAARTYIVEGTMALRTEEVSSGVGLRLFFPLINVLSEAFHESP
jgi:hypothetical protein